MGNKENTMSNLTGSELRQFNSVLKKTDHIQKIAGACYDQGHRTQGSSSIKSPKNHCLSLSEPSEPTADTSKVFGSVTLDLKAKDIQAVQPHIQSFLQVPSQRIHTKVKGLF